MFGTGSSFSLYRDANGNIQLKAKRDLAENVAVATSQYSTTLFDVGFKLQLSLSGDRYSPFYDLSPFSTHL